MNYKKILDFIIGLKHTERKESVVPIIIELKEVNNLISSPDGNDLKHAQRILKNRLTKLSKVEKQIDPDRDKEWADLIISVIPMKCPVYQCGGFMKQVIAKPPKGVDIDIEGYPGDEQTPNLICTNCKARYEFKGFKK